ncbi:hypothetical protein Leryth_017341 [Lithospermum erythrorhizon]|nr:hypothetical protein Leryth_017341 [Lithospermum erythrorhizon]
MALFFIFYLIMINVLMSFSETTSTNTLNVTCVDDATIVLTFGFYRGTCPEAESIIFAWVEKAVSEDPRMAASLLRLHFHDCFGCDASVLLDDRANFVGEKTAGPNVNSLRGFEVIDAIKADLETFCPETVSCADILALAARDSVSISGGPGWDVQMGRKDSLSASKSAANNNIPGPNSDLATLVSKFQAVGLSPNDVALQQLCGSSDANTTLANLDLSTPATFDNQYYVNLLTGEGLLPSDQALISGDDEARRLVESFVDDPTIFFEEFKKSMVKMGSLGSSSGGNGEIRRNCRFPICDPQSIFLISNI